MPNDWMRKEEYTVRSVDTRKKNRCGENHVPVGQPEKLQGKKGKYMGMNTKKSNKNRTEIKEG